MAPEDDAFDLDRFLSAQESTFADALEELRGGRKRSHWMWFIFPQLRGLGRSERARFYGIGSLEEARAYLGHPVLGPRLIEAVEAALESGEEDPLALFGSPDDMKFRSCLTLFAAADPQARVFRDALDVFYDGEPDSGTLDRLGLPDIESA